MIHFNVYTVHSILPHQGKKCKKYYCNLQIYFDKAVIYFPGGLCYTDYSI